MQENIINSTNHDSVKIAIFGVGGGGCNILEGLYNQKDRNLESIKMVATNTDGMALSRFNKMPGITVLPLGARLTKGYGAGNNPEVGRQAAENSLKDIDGILQDVDLLFLTAGMGGGTGTGASPVIAEEARKMDILTVGIVTTPFTWEGTKKMVRAKEGIQKLKQFVDVLVEVPNEQACRQDAVSNMNEAFRMANNVVHRCIGGVVEIVSKHSFMNTDFADIRTVMSKKGKVHIGVGYATGENRVIEALRRAVKDEQLGTSVENAHNVIVNIVSDSEVSADKIKEAFNLLPEAVADDADIITGMDFCKEKDCVKVIVIATGFDEEAQKKEKAENQIPKEKPTLIPRVGTPKEEPEAQVPFYLQYIRNKRGY